MTAEPGKAKPAEGAEKTSKGKARAGGWAAFTDGGAAPGVLIAARVVLLVALGLTFPVVLGLDDGNRILWTIAIPALPLFWVVAGYHVWRRICPLAVVGQVGRLVGRPGTRKAGGWLARNYLLVQLGVMWVALSLRLTATNGSAVWLAAFLGAAAAVALVVSFTYAGKTWCNFLCPVGMVEKIYTEPAPDARGAGRVTSQCSPCVACKKHCPDIDLEQGYWKEMEEPPRRIAYFAWPGLVVGFYTYYWLCAGTWAYYFDGHWAYEHDLPRQWLEPGLYFLHALPRAVAAPLSLLVFGAASYALFALGERLWVRLAVRAVPDDDAARRAEVRTEIRHRALALAGFVAFNTFYFWGGQPSLRRLPAWLVTGWGAVVVFASAAIFFRRWRRREADHVQERFAQKILKKWEWGDAPPSDNLQDIYLLHTERTKQREARLRAYKETVRELVADGTVTHGELVILDSLRAQLGITDKEHQKVIAQLGDEERQLFDPKYQGSVEERLHRQQYRRDLERIVMEAARAGRAPTPASLEALRRDHGATDAEEAEELARICAADGPVAALFREEVADIETLAAAAAAAAGGDDGSESASRALVRHLAQWRGRQHLLHALGLYGALVRRPDVDAARTAIERRAARPTDAVAELAAGDDGLLAPLAAATARLFGDATEPLIAPPILAIAGDGSPYLRAAAVLVLSRFDDDAARARVVGALDDAEPIVREAAVRSLGSRGRLDRDLLGRALGDDDARVRKAAVRVVSGGSAIDLPAIDPAQVAALARSAGAGGAAALYATLDDGARIETLTAIERMMLLRQVSMFADLDPDDLDELADRVEERHVQPGDDLCREGDTGDAVFLLVKGKVRVFTGGGDRPERTLSELGPGACIGEMAVFDAAPRSATVRALVKSRVLVVTGDAFKQLLLDRPEMGQAIIAELVRRMRGLMAVAPPAPPSNPPGA